MAVWAGSSGLLVYGTHRMDHLTVYQVLCAYHWAIVMCLLTSNAVSYGILSICHWKFWAFKEKTFCQLKKNYTCTSKVICNKIEDN